MNEEYITLWKKFSKDGIEEKLDTLGFKLEGNKLIGTFFYTKYDHRQKSAISNIKMDNIEIMLPSNPKKRGD